MPRMNLRIVAAAMAMAAIVSVLSAPALAGDKGPQRATATVTTNSAAVQPPIGDTGRFTPQWLTLSAPAGVTSTVKWVASGATGTISTTAASGLLSLTNVPTMFFGDHFTVVPSADTNGVALGTNSITVKVIGFVFD